MVSDGPQLRPETIDFLFDHLRESLEKQLATVDGLDGKVFQVFAAGSVLLGLTAVGQPERLQPWLLLGALAGYAGVSAAALAAVWPRNWRVIRHADTIWSEFWDLEPRAIKHALLQQVSDGYVANGDQIKAKARWLRLAVVALIAEATFVGVAVVQAAF
jgi:hypothetical protein